MTSIIYGYSPGGSYPSPTMNVGNPDVGSGIAGVGGSLAQ